jgi:hypothetical protein
MTMTGPGPRGRQLSLFGVEARPPTPLDLEGLLAGAGQVTRMGGTARVSIILDAAWRVAALRAECALRGLASTGEPSAAYRRASADPEAPLHEEVQENEGHLAFRTAYATALAPLGSRWLRGAVKHPPAGFVLDGRRLRLWVIAAGRPEGSQAYFLRLGASDATRLPDFVEATEPVWDAVGGALAAAGLPAVLLGPRAGGPAYRIVGRRRLARLAELIGEPPPQAPPDQWPV